MMQKRPLEPRDLYRLRLISDPRIAPDGRRVAFVMARVDEEKNDYIGNIYVAERDGTVTQFTSGDKDSAPRWSPDGRYLAFVSGRKERSQIHLLRMTGGESVALTDRKLGAGVPVWSPDSRSIAFAALVSTDPEEEETDEKEKKDDKKPAKTKIVDRASYKADGVGYIGNRRRHIFRVDVEGGSVEQLTDGDYHDSNPAWSPDGEHLAFDSSREERWDVSTGSDIYVIPRTGGQPRKVIGEGSYHEPIFSPDGSRIAFLGYENREDVFAPERLYSCTRDGADLRDELGDWDGQMGSDILSDVARSDGDPSATWRADEIYFLGTERGTANIYRSADGAIRPVTQGRHNVTDFSIADDGTIAYACADATHLIEVAILENGEPRPLTRENDALLAEAHITQPERITYTGAKGEESEGWLLAPRGYETGKHPLLIYIHGGPTAAHGESLFLEYQFLAGQGYGVFFPNIHGSSSYGREYQTSILRDWGNLDFQDVMAGTYEAMKRSWVDENRVGIIGGSYGGYMTIWAMGHSDLFRAGITERCLCNFVSFMGTSDGGWVWNRVTGTYPEDDIQKLWDMSPLKYVTNIKAPLMVMHYEGDDRTPIEQGEQIFNALRRRENDTKFIVFPEESHGMTRGGKPSRRVERMGYILDWFKEKL